SSGLQVDGRADFARDVVKVFRAQEKLQLSSALLVTVPVPEEFEVPAERLDAVLKNALEAAEQNDVSGRQLTPFLLAHMAKQSDGATLRANIALLENNARVASLIATDISTLRFDI